MPRLSPSELLLDPVMADPVFEWERDAISKMSRAAVEILPEPAPSVAASRRRLLEHFQVESLEGFGCEELDAAVRAATIVLDYLSQTQKGALGQITRLVTYSTASYMTLDPATRRNLELTKTIRSHERRGSLLWVLDRTKTAMGGRLLRQWIERPLLRPDEINRRLDAVQDLVGDGELRLGLEELLERVHDIQRLTGRVAHGSANGRDLVALKNSLRAVPPIVTLLNQGRRSATLTELVASLDACEDVADHIEACLVDEPRSPSPREV